MDDSELEALLSDLESDRVERKSSLTHPDEIRQAICAMANDLPNHRQPGVIFVGVDNNANCTHFAVTDERLRTLADMRSDGNITPFPTMTVQKRHLRGCDLAVVVVQPADAPPVRFQGRVWIRVGPRRAIATLEEERRLAEKRRAKDLPYDIQPVLSATLGDLDTDLFRRVYLPSALPEDILQQNERPIEQQLTSLRFMAVDPPHQPTVLGLLVVGKDPRQYLPNDYIQFLRFDGTELSDPIKDQKEIGGPLPDLLRALDETLQIQISVASDITGQSIETRYPDYPLIALQQLSRNAVMHRLYEGTNAPIRITWFEDRVEVQNPGGPFGQVTQQNFGQPGVTDYRNPHLAEAMKNLGYVQRFGVGIQLARAALAKNGNPPLEFQIESSHILVTIRRRS